MARHNSVHISGLSCGGLAPAVHDVCHRTPAHAQGMLRRGKLTRDGKRGAVRLRRRATVHQPWRCAMSERRAGHAGQRRRGRQQEDSRQREVARPHAPMRKRPSDPARLYAAHSVGYTHPDRSFATLPVAGELRPGMRQHAGWTTGSETALCPLTVQLGSGCQPSFLASFPPASSGCTRCGLPANTPPLVSRARRSAFTDGYAEQVGRSGKRLWRSRCFSMCLRALCGSVRSSFPSP